MINDSERRESAARLRELADANEGYLGMGRVNRVLRDGKAILGTSGLASVADVLRRHADLIAPEPERTCKMIPNGEDGICATLTCSECGNCESVYAVCADDFNFCPNCGAKVIANEQ